VPCRGNYSADLQCAQGLLDSRSLSLAAQVFELYPIVVDSSGYYSIHGAKLPPLHKMPEFEEDEVSTALGYTAHITGLLAKYLRVPLRFRMDVMGSRSRMKDDIYPSQPLSDGPLFSKGVEQKAFVAGLKMLERNVAQVMFMWCGPSHCPTDGLPLMRQVLNSQGLHAKPDEHMLSCLMRLFEHITQPHK
jgi:Vacuolar sorting 38 and autophagy-related subunit 14